MKFTIKKDLLLDALNKVARAISTKNLIPVLAGVKFDLKKKKLYFINYLYKNIIS